MPISLSLPSKTIRDCVYFIPSCRASLPLYWTRRKHNRHCLNEQTYIITQTEDGLEETHLPVKKSNFSLLSNDYMYPVSLLSLCAVSACPFTKIGIHKNSGFSNVAWSKEMPSESAACVLFPDF